MTRLVAPAAVALVFVLALVAWRGGGEDPYVVRLELSNASGLRDGARVAVAGVDAGEVRLRVERRKVIAELELDQKTAPIGKDARASIVALNLLGQKRVDLARGDVRTPAPSGSTIPESKVAITTDLDQVLAVLGPQTRTRLAVLINEAGRAVTGRRTDINELVRELGPVVSDAERVVGDLIADNRALGDLVDRSDRSAAAVVAEREQLSGLVRSAGSAADAVASRRRELQQTIAAAPSTLRSARTFLADLERTAAPLGLAAGELRRTAPALDRTLAQLEPFRKAAAPALGTATDTAPALTKLATGATPTLKRSVPVLGNLAEATLSLRPVTKAADGSIDNLVATLENWSRAIQFRDGLSHVFRGEATVTPDLVQTYVNRLRDTAPARDRREAAPKKRRPKPAAPSAGTPKAPEAAPKVPNVVERLPQAVQDLIDPVGEAVQGITDGVTGVLPKGGGQSDQRNPLDDLLGR